MADLRAPTDTAGAAVAGHRLGDIGHPALAVAIALAGQAGLAVVAQAGGDREVDAAVIALVQVLVHRQIGRPALAPGARPEQAGVAVVLAIGIAQAQIAGAERAESQQIGADRGLFADARRQVALQRAQVAVISMAANGAQIDVESAVVPAVAQCPLLTLQAMVVAVRIGGVEHARTAEQPPAADAGLGQTPTAFGMRFTGKGIAHAAAPAGTGHGAIVVGEGALAEILTQVANADRPVRQALGQQLLGAIETEIQRLHAPECIGHHHLCTAGAADAGLRGQLEWTDRHLPAVLAQAVDVQLDRGRHHGLAEEAGGGREHAVGLQAVVAADLQATHAHGAGPVDETAVEVADVQGHRPVGEVQAPAGVQAHALTTPAAVTGLLVAAADRRVFEGAVADPEQAQLRAEAEVAERFDPAAIDVVVQQQTRRGAAGRCAGLRLAEHGGRQGQLVQWHVQGQGLHMRVVAHHGPADLVQIDRRIAAGAEAELAQHVRTGLQPATVFGERQQAARRAVERDIQVKRLAGGQGRGRRQDRIGRYPGDIRSPGSSHAGHIGGLGRRRSQGNQQRAHQRLSEPVVATAASVPTRH